MKSPIIHQQPSEQLKRLAGKVSSGVQGEEP
jgi:hypothetical protein